jgi:hypothetical protein
MHQSLVSIKLEIHSLEVLIHLESLKPEWSIRDCALLKLLHSLIDPTSQVLNASEFGLMALCCTSTQCTNILVCWDCLRNQEWVSLDAPFCCMSACGLKSAQDIGIKWTLLSVLDISHSGPEFSWKPQRLPDWWAWWLESVLSSTAFFA